MEVYLYNMGPLGTQELVFIFILALLLFGPKKLPELGRTIGKAMTEFRRAQSELKSTFDREMKNLERETGLQELTATTYQASSYDYDHSAYDPAHYDENGAYSGSYNSTVTTPTTNGASATQGAESKAGLQIEAAAGSIASGHLEAPHTGAPETAAAPAEHGSVPPAEPGADTGRNTVHG
jgi:sec-independent protein translocase protein TatA